jgi:hypothetical protein
MFRLGSYLLTVQKDEIKVAEYFKLCFSLSVGYSFIFSFEIDNALKVNY